MWQDKSLFYTIVSEYIIILSTQNCIIVFFYSTSVYVLFGPGIYTVKFKHCKMRSLVRSKCLCLMKSSSKMFQICHIFGIRTSIYFFLFSFHATNLFPPNECPGICFQRPGHSLLCKKISKKWKQKKMCGFSNLKNITNFEVFR